MGPTLIFDKSFLESLNPDEAVWLDQFYLCNVTPLFFVETLADLDKRTRRDRTPEDIVGSLAYRTPDLHSKSNIYHRTLLEGELSGEQAVDMDTGRPCIGGGRYVDLGGKTGAFFDATPEEEAMMRWQEHKFLEVERQYARKWRSGLSNADLEEIYAYYQERFAGYQKPKSMAGVRQMVESYFGNPNQEAILRSALSSLGATDIFVERILARWVKEGSKPVRVFAPYLAYVHSIDLTFMFGIGCDLIGRGRASHKIDVAYLYYLPFCKVFTSSDKLHKLLVPLFLRDDQSFVSGEDLKNDLRELDAHYSAMSDADKARGVYFFASVPPPDTRFLTTRMWDKYMSSTWRDLAELSRQHNPVPNDQFMTHIDNLVSKAKTEGVDVPPHGTESSTMVIKRMVSAKRGKWSRFPPEVTRRRRNADGKWEDSEQLS